MPIPKDYREIIDSLISKTDLGNVHWDSTTTGVELQVDGSRIAMWAGNDEHTEEPFVSFALKNVGGSIVDTWYVDSDDVDYEAMNLLFAAAKRHANGVPELLSKLRKSIVFSPWVGEKR